MRRMLSLSCPEALQQRGNGFLEYKTKDLLKSPSSDIFGSLLLAVYLPSGRHVKQAA